MMMGLTLGNVYGFCMAASAPQESTRLMWSPVMYQAAQLAAISPAMQQIITCNNLIAAIQSDDRHLVEKLISMAEVPVNSHNECGWSPLHAAAAAGHKHTCLLLLRAKAVVDTPDNYAHTPLMDALASGHTQCAELLLRADASPDGVHCDSTPLRLVLRGAQLNLQQDFKNVIERVKFLLEAGANPDLRDERGILPIDELAPSFFKDHMALLIVNTKKREELKLSCEGFNRPFSTRIESDNQLISIKGKQGVDEDKI